MIVRFVLTAIFVFLVYTFISALLRLLFGGSSSDDGNRDGLDGDDQMVQCAACGTYVPRRDAIRKKKRGQDYYFCDDKCLKEYKKRSR